MSSMHMVVVFVQPDVAPIMRTAFYRPVAPPQLFEQGRARLALGQVGDAISDRTAGATGLEDLALTRAPRDMRGPWPAQPATIARRAFERPRFHPAVRAGDGLNAIPAFAIRGNRWIVKEPSQIVAQASLIGL